LDFALPADLVAYLANSINSSRARSSRSKKRTTTSGFFDHRREWARTDFENGGLPRHQWEALLRRVKNLADSAGTCASRSRNATAARTAPISGWR